MTTLARPARVAGPSLRRPDGAGLVVSLVSVAALATLVAAQVTVPALVAAAAPALAVGGLLLGLPHGAVDHLVPFWATGNAVTVRRLARVLVVYVAVAAVAATALLLVPGPSVLVFLVVSALHFGRGEVVFAAERSGGVTPPWRTDPVLVLAHGAVVVALPYAVWSEQSGALLQQLSPVLADPPGGIVDGLLVLTAAVVAVAATMLASRRRWPELAELAVLTTCFAVVPPLAAFGVYFGVWHAGRHTSRLLGLAAASAPPGAGPRWALVRYVRDAAAPTLVAAAALAAVASTDDASLLAAELAVLLALTFPHVQTVAAFDRASARRPRLAPDGTADGEDGLGERRSGAVAPARGGG